MPKNPGRTALYRLFDEAGALLYVGISHKPDVRWGQHSEQKAWWPAVAQRAVEWHETRSGAEKAELAAIATERPSTTRWALPLTRSALPPESHPPARSVSTLRSGAFSVRRPTPSAVTAAQRFGAEHPRAGGEDPGRAAGTPNGNFDSSP
ncbi:GIY-YIG nuclease family protein [Streptomyces sp. NBC_01498]|uniref:GIY-YIG nuclease family protein n=1 Tax=Streptomyces sp. NBC_01498 TaxID=2975870 RepID=UPI003FCCE658